MHPEWIPPVVEDVASHPKPTHSGHGTTIPLLLICFPDALKDGKELSWTTSMYPDLHMPFAPSWSLHWVYRDGHLVNLPVSLLVTGDVVALRPGQESFTSLRGIKVTQVSSLFEPGS